MIKQILISALSLSFAACAGSAAIKVDTSLYEPHPYVKLKHPDWSKDAVIYQINTRQYSEAGTFKAVEQDLERLQLLGVDILWLMPIHPIGEVNRKGSLGSPYAVKDFRAVNPELGSLEEFKSLVNAAQAKGMKVIIDWVANHTSWDNALVMDHPDWFTRDLKGQMQPPPGTDWADVVDLDYSKVGLRKYMTEALKYWVEDVGIDGYRADVAGFVPLDFWETARAELDAVKPVFMLAEWRTRDLHARAFDASYAWPWKETMQDIAKGRADAGGIRGYYHNHQNTWPRDSMRMAYTENHDQNSWDGSTGEIYGEALEAAMALSFTGEGIPLIYNGQESGNQKRLEFFEKDPIIWKRHPHNDLITELSALKEENKVLWNGAWGAPLEVLKTSHDKQVFSFIRRGENRAVFAVFNLSSSPVQVSFEDDVQYGDYITFMTDEAIKITAETKLTLEPWDYSIYIR